MCGEAVLRARKRTAITREPDGGFPLRSRAGDWTMLGGDPHELLAVCVTAVFFVETTRRVASRVITGAPARTSCTRDPGWVLSSKQARDSVFKRIVITPLFKDQTDQTGIGRNAHLNDRSG